VKKRIIVGGTSAIGSAVAASWAEDDDYIQATTRPHIPAVESCDTLLLTTGHLHIGPMSTNYPAFYATMRPNLLNPLFSLHLLYPHLRPNAHIIFLAGSGLAKSAPYNGFYTATKIALARMVEEFHEEEPALTFTALSPGWVKTPMTEGAEPPDPSYWQPMERVVAFIKWAAEAPREVVGGRIISIHDGWEEETYAKRVALNPDYGKLRRIKL
jgi:NAD(P)-dependent dehydrogenase (short-subunit alcohol dehydrogenase family)